MCSRCLCRCPWPSLGGATAPWAAAAAGGIKRRDGQEQAWETVVVSRRAGELLKRDGDSEGSSEQRAAGRCGPSERAVSPDPARWRLAGGRMEMKEPLLRRRKLF